MTGLGWLAAFAVAVLAAETGFLLRVAGRRGWPPGLILWNGVAGVGLLAALLAALADAGAVAVVAGLTLGLAGHVADLAARRRVLVRPPRD